MVESGKRHQCEVQRISELISGQEEAQFKDTILLLAYAMIN